MAKLDVLLNVSDLAVSVDFYTRLFGTPPQAHDGDEAVFILADPDIHLTIRPFTDSSPQLMSGMSLMVESRRFVFVERDRLEASGMITPQGRPGCLYTNPDRLFVRDPDSNRWDIFRRPSLEEAPEDARPAKKLNPGEPFSTTNQRLSSRRPALKQPEA